MPASALPDHKIRLVHELTECFIREAVYMARLTIHYLDKSGFYPPELRIQDRILPPPCFLLELSAVLRIAVWERQNLRDLIAADLPRAEDAYRDLLTRAALQPSSFPFDSVNAPLHRRVMDAIGRNLVWSGSREMSFDVVLGGLPNGDDEEAAIEAFARFLWARRHSSNTQTQENREADRG